MKNHLPLADLQKKILGLVKDNYLPEYGDENYFHSVAKSSNLQLVRAIALWWRQNHLERYCFFTSRFLKATGQMETTTARYFQANNHSSFIEEIGPHFLSWLSKNTIGLTSIIARFELGMIAINRNEAYEDEIVWPCDPFPIIYGLVQNDLSNESIQSGSFSMTLSDKIIGSFEVEEITSISLSANSTLPLKI
ncbi:hypothetical protein L0657_14635 [Dyadobacter sp. CY345]|uniref:hypothetical protein n=1 Tax=Dyadobacter sp. CY345 TaxID=2909335 RepID=UPI001F3538B5|nr:hypothetical protein [Dyadobacter sp. CY345]MCF2445202.1 hypothetical protein [Dyadobacter sp. CY345]